MISSGLPLLIGAAAGLLATAGIVPFIYRRALRKAAEPFRDDCAYCRQPLPAERYWLQGKCICPNCAARMRPRLEIAFWALVAVITLFGASGVIALIVSRRRGDPDPWVGFAVIEACTLLLAGLFLFSLKTMKWENTTGQTLRGLDVYLHLLGFK